MRLIIASDIHGHTQCCAALLQQVKQKNPDRLLLLGDLLYHGSYDAEDFPPVDSQLNPLADRILAVKGNCDRMGDQFRFAFPMLEDTQSLLVDGWHFVLAHGHQFIPEKQPAHLVFLTGHTHIPQVEEHQGWYRLNPGSLSFPRGNSQNSFLWYADGVFQWLTLAGEPFMTFTLPALA